MKPDPAQICFGLSPEHDRRSLAIFLQLCGARDFAELLAGRLDGNEINTLADQIMALLRRHLSEDEYHRVFLKDRPSR
jgi:hypothetical protein